MRLVEDDDGRKIGVFHCEGGEMFAIEDRCSHDDGPLAEGEFDQASCTVECPRHGSVFDLRTGKPKSLPAYAPVDTFEVSVQRRRSEAGDLDEATTRNRRTRSTKVLTDAEAGLKDIGSDYKERFGFSDPETGYSYKAPKGLSRELIESISEYKSEPQWMRDFRLKAYEHYESRPTPKWGGNLDQIDFEDIHYFVRASEKVGHTWDDVPEDIKNTFDKLGIPEAERKFLAGVGAQYESESVYHQVNEQLEAQGVIFTDMDTALKRARGPRPRVLGDRDPGERQQARRAELGRLVGRLVRLRPQGRQGLDAAPGLLPHQHGEHGPVRAHADHRRGGLGRPLHRGLHRPRVLDRLAPLRRRRDRREALVTRPLHDRPELVAERLQPRHQARDRAGERDDGVGRLQPRLEADDEVPVDLPARRGRPRRDPLDRVRRQGPAPGRRRQDHPRGPEDDVVDLLQVDLEGRRPGDLPRPPRGREGRLARRSRRSSATRSCSTPSRARTPTRRSGSTSRTPTSATRPRSRRSARSSSSTSSRAASTRKRPRR